jgi:hypothetical protein
LILSYFSIVYYFAPHIYGNPFHHCAYCILQNHYNYAGYFIYGSLFLSTYYAIGFIFFTFMQNSHKKILFFTTLFIFLANIFKTFTQA